MAPVGGWLSLGHKLRLKTRRCQGKGRENEDLLVAGMYPCANASLLQNPCVLCTTG